jgi:PAS domain S-box-containing protein
MEAVKGRKLTREDVLGHKMWDEFPLIAQTSAYARMHGAMRDRESVAFDYRYPDGPWFEVYAYPSADGLAMYFRDITERHRAEEALREAQRQTEAVLQSITDEFIGFDERWGYSYLNDSALQTVNKALGSDFTREDLIGQTVWDLFPSFADSSLYAELEPARRARRAVRVESYSERDDRWVEVHAYPSKDGGLSIYTRNITDRKEAEKRVVEAREVERGRPALCTTRSSKA